MTSPQPPDQAAIWNGPRARGWVEEQALLDRMFAPFEVMLADAAASATNVLDIGCGTGATSIAIARRLGANGKCTGIDISEPMLALARERARQEAYPPTFVIADAQTYPFAAGSFDLLTSRFGVMFFEDPVAAFMNLRRASKHDGSMRLIAWRSPADNPFMTVAEKAAAHLLPELPPRTPNAPGQFAFADPQYVRGILEQSSWAAIDIQPLDIVCAFPAADLERYSTRLGPVGGIFPELDPPTQAQVIEILREAFRPYVHAAEVRFNAACWSIAARNA